jgi:hypothetical protein
MPRRNRKVARAYSASNWSISEIVNAIFFLAKALTSIGRCSLVDRHCATTIARIAGVSDSYTEARVGVCLAGLQNRIPPPLLGRRPDDERRVVVAAVTIEVRHKDAPAGQPGVVTYLPAALDDVALPGGRTGRGWLRVAWQEKWLGGEDERERIPVGLFEWAD